MPVSAAYRPAPIHAALGDQFYDLVEPAIFPLHRLRYRNQRWARRIGLDTLSCDEWVNHFGRFAPLPVSLEEATARMLESAPARELLGEAFVSHFAATRDWECRQFRAAVTDWELTRYFENI